LAEIRREGDQTLFQLEPKERQVLLEIVDRIEPMLGSSRWVSPRAYGDEGLEREFRRLAGDDLERSRDADLATLREGLAGPLPVRLGDSDVWGWVRALNFLRLALAEQLGISEDGWEERYSPRQHRRPPLATLHLLSWLQEELIDSLA
jgi:hypothetical protein